MLDMQVQRITTLQTDERCASRAERVTLLHFLCQRCNIALTGLWTIIGNLP